MTLKASLYLVSVITVYVVNDVVSCQKCHIRCVEMMKVVLKSRLLLTL